MDKVDITLSDVDHLAELSGLEFSEYDKKIMLNEINCIIDMFNGCAEAGEFTVEQDKSVGLNDLRDDEVMSSLGREEVFMNTPKADKGFVVVPKVVD